MGVRTRASGPLMRSPRLPLSHPLAAAPRCAQAALSTEDAAELEAELDKELGGLS